MSDREDQVARKAGIRRHASRGGRAPGAQRQAEGRDGRCPAPQARSLRRCDLGRRLPHGRRDRTGDGARRGTAHGLRRAHRAAASDMGETALPRHAHRQGPRTSAPGSASSAACTDASGAAPTSWSTSRFGCCGPIATDTGIRVGRQTLHRIADPGDRREEGRVPVPAGESGWPALQHGAAADVAEEPAARAARARSTVHRRRPQPQLSVAVALRPSFRAGHRGELAHPGDYETYVGTRAASEPETRNVIWLLDRYPQIRYFIDLHATAKRSCTAGAPTKTSRTTPR